MILARSHTIAQAFRSNTAGRASGLTVQAARHSAYRAYSALALIRFGKGVFHSVQCCTVCVPETYVYHSESKMSAERCSSMFTVEAYRCWLVYASLRLPGARML